MAQKRIQAFLSDESLLSDDEYEAQKESIDAEIKNIDSQHGIAKEEEEQADIQTAKALTFAALAVKRFEEKNPKIQRDIFKGLAGLNLNFRSGTVNFDSPNYIETVAEIKKDVDEVEKRVEPSDLLANTSQMEQLYASIPTMLRGLEEIRTYFLTETEPVFIPDLN